jgi:hypothetical protein
MRATTSRRGKTASFSSIQTVAFLVSFGFLHQGMGQNGNIEGREATSSYFAASIRVNKNPSADYADFLKSVGAAEFKC